MKKVFAASGNSRWLITCALLAAFGLGFGALRHKPNLVVHEWGTFTSVQGGDGVPLNWRPLQSSKLPQFVYNWQHPGLSRIRQAMAKGEITGLQRMETPVLYFYSGRNQSVDVSVTFPKGTITEWFPQAAQIGPATVAPPPPIPALDAVVHKAGAGPNFSFSRFVRGAATTDSRVHWTDVKLLSANESTGTASHFPSDSSGSHYFAARATDANPLRIDALERTNSAAEFEKFLFYRGVGSFETPLVVTAGNDDSITLSNAGPDTLKSLVALRIEKGRAWSLTVQQLAVGQVHRCELGEGAESATAQSVRGTLQVALVEAGLYPKEAAAMVNTWKDSWLEEEGTRVLYILPRKWTDQILPITISPAPEELVRVMVGRAEVITPGAQQQLRTAITRAGMQDRDSRNAAMSELKRFGRFAEPALTLAMKEASRQQNEIAWKLLAGKSD